jgi:adenylate kinase
LGRLIKKTIDAGKLLPDRIVNRIVRERLKQKDVAKGVIIDGYPRTLAEAEFLDTLVELDAVVLLDVSDAVAMKRLAGRLVCPVDGRVYGPTIPPKKKGVCDSHNVKLVQRPDDTPEAIRTRLEVYHEETEPLSEYYKPRNLVIRIDADRKPDVIVKDVLRRLG